MDGIRGFADDADLAAIRLEQVEMRLDRLLLGLDVAAPAGWSNASRMQRPGRAPPAPSSARARRWASCGPSRCRRSRSCAVSARHCSRLICAPSVWSSSLDQAIGLVPYRIMCGSFPEILRCLSNAAALLQRRPHSPCVPCALVSRAETSGTATSHQWPPASVAGQRVGVDDDDRRCGRGLRAAASAASSSAIVPTFTAFAPMLAACATKSMCDGVSRAGRRRAGC